jgi:alpha,alpha-trehalase
MGKYSFLLFTALFSIGVATDQESFMPCDNDIYCYGDIIHTVQQAQIYKDSKTFVDMPLKYEPNTVKTNFEFMIKQHGPQPPKEEIQKFLDHNFHPAGYEFQEFELQDWTANPKFLSGINDTNLRTFASELNAFWKVLGRNIKKDVKIRPEMYSMIYVDNPVVVPGGRFREFYYWDQFWILKGLLHCEMTSSVRGILENFLQMVEQLGYIPNGGRIYYQRSQPPMLIPMVQDYLDATKNTTFLKAHIDTLDKEFDFWMTNRSYTLEIDGTTYDVTRYNVELGNPRPESYHEDYELASEVLDIAEKTELYEGLKTAAESGIDFSYRWFLPKDPTKIGNLKDCKAQHFIPVDLNVLILRNALILQKFHTELNNTEKAENYGEIAATLEQTINAVFWNETLGSWFDYVTVDSHQGHKTEFFPGNILPLILGLPSMTNKTTKVLKYLNEIKIFSYDGGIPSSLEPTSEQWDFPNAWAPHNHWFIESLEATGNADAQKLAEETAQKWVANNYKTYRSHQDTMFEKYDAANPGSYGGGGEYDVVVGFGWSNGVVLDLLSKYGQKLTVPPTPPNPGTPNPNSSSKVGIALQILLFSLSLRFLLA